MRKTLRFMKRFGRGLLPVFVAYLIMLPCITGSVWAYVYDDFTTTGIDPTKWWENGPNSGLFSQPGDGYLYFNSSQPFQNDGFVAVNTVDGTNPVTGSSSITMKFSDFSWSGNPVSDPTYPYQVFCSSVYLGMSAVGSDTSFWVGRLGINLGVPGYTNYNGFAAYKIVNGYTTDTTGFVPVPWDLTSVSDGMLGINYDDLSHQMSFRYDDGTGWKSIGGIVDTGWSTVPYFLIGGTGGDSTTSTSFRVDNVQIFPSTVPEPATMLLLGLGLMGVAGIRRRMH